jgi:glutamate-1-semialdehyde 2,1-aminomutase
MSTDPGSRSVALAQAADDLLGYGGQHRMLLRHLYAGDEEAFPRFAEHAEGCRLRDTDGTSYVDWISGGGPVLLGYRHPGVERAVVEQLEAGPTLSLMHPVELEVAAALKEMIPCAEMVTFGKNGSDVVTAAVRVARAVTGREVILQYGVHGFHDWYVSMFAEVEGQPEALRDLVHPFPYNDLDALGALFDRFRGRVAAVVMEPTNVALPEPGYLEGVRELAAANGALLVFDEMITGFRLANGGAQERFGVMPDLACFGKALANGMPLSALVGKRSYMQRLTSVAYGMTFRGETLSLAAARVVLALLRREPVAERLAETGTRVRGGFDAACARHGVRATLRGPEARMTFDFAPGGGMLGQRIQTAFLKECARAGVLTNGNILPSLAHDEDALRETADAFDAALAAVSRLVRAGTAAVSDAVRVGFHAADPAPSPNGAEPAGCFDMATTRGEELLLHGWIVPAGGAPDAIDVIARTGNTHTAAPLARPDVAEALPGVAGAERSGFAAALPASGFAHNGEFDCVLRARRSDETVFLAHIVTRRDGDAVDAVSPRWDAEEGTLYVT